MAAVSDVISMLDSINWVTSLLAVMVCLIAYLGIKWANIPPGPTGIPYLGYYPFLSHANFHKELAELTKKYGDVFCFTITGQTYVHLGSFKSMREALVTKSDCFMKKSSNYNLLLESVSDGIFYASGEPWKVLRKFFVQRLKDYGMGKKGQEAWLGDSLQRTVDALKKSQGKDFDLTAFFTDNCTLAVSQLLLGLTTENCDDGRRLTDAFQDMILSITGKDILLAGPLLKYVLMHFMPSAQRHTKAIDEMHSILIKILREHEREFDKDNIRDMVDCYIDERRILQEKGDPRYKIYTERAFAGTLLQVFGDGAVTIGALAATVIKAIASHPEVQRRIQSEIDEVVGRERFPTLEDKARMPFTNAVIYEATRQADFFPIFPSLECTEDTVVSGCRVPKGSILLLNFHSALKDPRVYPDPEKFDPTRFLPAKDDKKIKTELPNIFGMGKRSCIGEALTNMETFLFVAAVMQNFDLLLASSKKEGVSVEWNILIRAVPRKF